MTNTSTNTQEPRLSKKENEFRDYALNGNLWGVIFYVCLPLAIFQIVNHLFNILDTMMASHVSAIAVSAVSYLSQLQSVISAIGMGFAVGGSLKISEAYGKGDYALVKKRLSTLVAICIMIAALLLVSLPFTSDFLRIIGTPEEFVSIGTKYFIITMLATILSFFNNIYIAIERSRGNSKRILKLNMGIIIIKLCFTSIFVYVLNADITMIAVATVISQSLLFIMAVKNLCFGSSAFSFSYKSVTLHKNIVIPIFSISFPVIVEKSAFSLGKTVVNSMIKNYGYITVGSLGISNKICGISSQFQNGFQDGCASIISQNMGAGNKRRAIETFKKVLIINMTVGLIFCIILNLFINQITFLFANTQNGLDVQFQNSIIEIFRLEAIGSCVPLGVNSAVMALLFGLGKTKLTLVCNFCRVFVFRIPLLYILQHYTDLGSISAGVVMGVSNVLTCVLAAIIAIVVIHNLKKEMPDS